MTENDVTVTFTDGTQLDVETVTRYFGAEWMFASIQVETDDDDDIITTEQVILRSEKVRSIRCDYTTKPTESDGEIRHNIRIHHGDTLDKEMAQDQVSDLWIAHNLPLSDDDTSRRLA